MNRTLFPLLGLVAALGACADTSLDGSLSEAFDLSFQTVELKRSPTAIQVSYLRSEGREVVARITVATAGLDLGGEIDLGGEYAPGHPRTVVTRAVDGEPVRTLPPVASGALELDGSFDAGSDASGHFALAFGEGGDVGAGRSLSGDFAGKVQAAR